MARGHWWHSTQSHSTLTELFRMLQNALLAFYLPHCNPQQQEELSLPFVKRKQMKKNCISCWERYKIPAQVFWLRLHCARGLGGNPSLVSVKGTWSSVPNIWNARFLPHSSHWSFTVTAKQWSRGDSGQQHRDVNSEGQGAAAGLRFSWPLFLGPTPIPTLHSKSRCTVWIGDSTVRWCQRPKGSAG